VARSAFAEQEVQPYFHVELRALFSPSSSLGREDGDAEARLQSTGEPSEKQREPDEEQLEQLSPPSVEEALAATQQQAESILAFARQEAEQLRQAAYAQGLASGQADGREQAKQEFLPALVVFAQIGQSLIILEEQLIERFTPHLVRFALEVAEKVVGKAVDEDPLIVASVLERARMELPQARSIRIWLHPLDHQVLTECRPDLVWVGEKGGRTVEVVPSEEIERGGCRIETEMGIVDATVPVQLQEIRRQMLE
jgi:flagellar assembly protein FliH